jgi:hypothetical protein
VTSNWCREQFIKYHHIPEDKIVTIPTGVSKQFTYSNKKSKTFIYTSIPYKGLEVLAKIIPHIPEATFKIFSAMNLYDIQEDPYTELYEYLKSLPNVIYSPAVDQSRTDRALTRCSILYSSKHLGRNILRFISRSNVLWMLSNSYRYWSTSRSIK